MLCTLLDERLQVRTDHPALMQRVTDFFEFRGIALDHCADGGEDRIESGELAFQVSDCLGRFLDAGDEIGDFDAGLEGEGQDAEEAGGDADCFGHGL